MTIDIIVRRGSRPKSRAFAPEPHYPLPPLIQATGLSWEEMAARRKRSKTFGFKRLRDGLTWAEADEWAVGFGLLPYEVWPEWNDADPSSWCDLGPDFAAELLHDGSRQEAA